MIDREGNRIYFFGIPEAFADKINSSSIDPVNPSFNILKPILSIVLHDWYELLKMLI
jgi:hypothetical protein